MVIATFLLGGWDSPIYLGDEQQRQRDPGRSVLISITFCTLWVIFLFICLQGLASSSAITANASNVLPFLAGRLGPKAFADLVALAVIASFATTIQSQIVDGSRIMFGMGRDRTVPTALGRVNPRFRTPVAGLVVMGVIPVLALVLYLASSFLQKTIVYIDSTGGLLFAGYYVVISLYSIWYYRTVLFRDRSRVRAGAAAAAGRRGDAGLRDRQVAARHADAGADHRAGAVPGRDTAGLLVQGDHARAVLRHAAGALHRKTGLQPARDLVRFEPWACGVTRGWAGTMRWRSTTGRRCARPGSGGSGRSRRPLIGIACTASDLNRCDRGLTMLAAAVRRGVQAAGGLPLEFPVMSLSEDLMKPTAMLYRNLLAIEVEETIRSQPLDGIVALGNCDKTVPAYLMALASADIPALIVTGGFRVPASFDGAPLGQRHGAVAAV